MATFGKTDVGAANFGTSNAFKDGSIFQAPASGTVTAMNVYIVQAVVTVKFAVYNSAAGAPTTLVGSSGASAGSAGNDWVTVSGLNIAIVSGNFYWLCFKGSAAAVTGKRDADSSEYVYDAEPYGDAFVDPWVGGNYEDFVISIYATYTPSGALSIPVAMHHYGHHFNIIKG